MKKGVLGVALIFTSLLSFGQCPTANIALLNQSDVDNFVNDYPNCTEVQLLLSVGIGSGSNITNLNGLSGITRVGIANGGSGGSFLIQGNPQLQSLAGLENLEFVGGTLSIRNTAITNFEGLDNLTELRDGITVGDNPNLLNFEGLASLGSLESWFQVFNNASLVNFQGLGTIVSLFSGGGILSITENPSLTSLDGLEGLESVRNFTFDDNQNLTSIDAVANINLVGTTSGINITNNMSLSQCAITVVCNIIDDPNYFKVIVNNAIDCNSVQEVSNRCLLSTDEYSLENAIMIYPNPVSEMLTVETANGLEVEALRLFSILGEEVLIASENSLDVSNLSEGMYLLEIKSSVGKTTKKIIKN